VNIYTERFSLLSLQYPTHSEVFSDNAVADVIPPAFAGASNLRRRTRVLGLAVGAIVIPGLFATLAIPAYAAEPDTPVQQATSVNRQLHDDAQTFTTPTVTVAADVQRDSFKASSVAALHRKRAALRVAAGPSVGAILANPPYPHFDLARVAAVAEKYQGVPYVYGGESPSGFDCSGLVAYVYAQFGISLPHSSAEQGAMGTRIATSAAKPGDVVVMSGGSHVGIYLGNGRMIDAPEPGRKVSERAIYTSDYYIVRFGI
jgi:cell wall-associated NlpC family hydrolase